MKQRELRLGNWVYSCKGGIEARVGILITGGQYPYEPIPLTEEWLVKFGFENRVGMQWYLGDIRVNMSTPTTMIFYKDEQNEMQRLILKDKFVHTLQNAWHLITGEEL